MSEIFAIYPWVHFSVFAAGFAVLSLPLLAKFRYKTHPLIPGIYRFDETNEICDHRIQELDFLSG